MNTNYYAKYSFSFEFSENQLKFKQLKLCLLCWIEVMLIVYHLLLDRLFDILPWILLEHVIGMCSFLFLFYIANNYTHIHVEAIECNGWNQIVIIEQCKVLHLYFYVWVVSEIKYAFEWRNLFNFQTNWRKQ